MSTSSSVTSSTVNGTTRITGLASGLDVDSIVTQLLRLPRSLPANISTLLRRAAY